MGGTIVNQAMNLQQDRRPVLTELFAQGGQAASKEESFVQTETPTGDLDILIVVDNSRSMEEEQVNLSTKLEKLLTYIGDSQWRIAVETTDPADGCGRYLIDKDDPDIEARFAAAINRGVDGSGLEQGIYQAVNGLSCDGGQWLRPNSTVAVLIVSDEDNCSDGTRCGDSPWASASYLTDYLSQIRVLGFSSRVYGLFWHPEDFTCTNALRQGFVYREAIDATNGSWGAICDNDYSNTLVSISENLGKILETQFNLAYNVKAGSAKVYINDVLQPDGYTIVGNVLKFDLPPPRNAQIRISYEYQLDEPRAKFVLSKAKEIEKLSVYLDGSLTTDFEFNDQGSQSFIEFATPPNVKEILVRYEPKITLKNRFSIPPGIGENLQVFVEGKKVTDYRLADGNLILAEAPAAGSSIRLEYPVSIGERYDYELFVPSRFHDSIEVFDASNGENLDFYLEGGKIVFSSSSYLAEREVIIRYKGLELGRYDVGRELIENQLAYIENSSGEICNDLVVVGSEIDYSNCGFQGVLHLSFWYEDIIDTRYPVFVEDKDRVLSYSVTLNDESINNYRIENGWLELTEPPAEGDVIVITAKLDQ